MDNYQAVLDALILVWAFIYTIVYVGEAAQTCLCTGWSNIHCI